MLAGPLPDRIVVVSGDIGRTGGVPNRGGLGPNDSFSADDRADSPGPGRDAPATPSPASGVCDSDGSAVAS